MPSDKPRNSGSREVRCQRRDAGGFSGAGDTVVVEEPLELRVDGKALATIMRTPGHDQELALGFFFAEGWVTSAGDVGALAFCGRESGPSDLDRPGDSRDRAEEENVVDLLSPSGTTRKVEPVARLPVSSSCGVCGKRTIEEVFARTPLSDSGTGDASGDHRLAAGTDWSIDSTLLARLPEALRDGQALFETTGALHAAGLFDLDGRPLVVREDIGRHNAVDKVVGWAFLEKRLPLSRCVLQVSGRTSFEIVQKAYAAGIPFVAGVSGVSSLAIDLAGRVGMTLVGFARGESFMVYCEPGRIEGTVARDAQQR